jgi:RHS repeat-associated protein
VREEIFDAGSVLLRRVDSTYDVNGNRTSSTLHRTVDGTSTPLTTQYAYDAANRRVAVTDPLGGVSRTEYDAGGKVTAMIDALGRRSTYAYDQLSRLSSITYPDATSETWTYDAESNVIATTDRAGRTMSHVYDELKRQVKTTFADGSSTHTVYTPGGRVAATIDAKGNRTDYAYDTAGRRIATTLPAVANGISGPPLVRPQVSTTLGALGTPVSATDANGRVTTFLYDANGRLTRTTHPDGSTQLQTWDALGRRTSLTNEEGQTTTFGHDGLGRLVTVSGLAGNATYAYDQAGNLVTQTDALGRITRYRYDALNRLVEKTYPGGDVQRYTYDAVGNLVAHIDGMGRMTTFTYNAMNRLIAKTLPGGVTIAYGYKADGQRASVTDPRGVTNYGYDSVGRLASVTHPTGEVVSYARDANGNLLSLASPAATVNYGYDALNRLLQVNSPEGESNSFYDLVGNRVRQTAANGIVTDVNYDSRNRPATLTHKNASSAVLQSFSNVYSPSGRRSQVTEQDGSVEAYSYDASGRLTAEVRTGSAPYNITHAYDAVGNRTQSVRGGTPTTFTYNANDQLVSDGASSYSYDANGNLIARTSGSTSTQFGYDAQDRLSTVLDSTGVSQYTYDADGNRVSANTAAGLARFLVDHGSTTGYSQVLEERNGGGALLARYSYGNEMLAMSQGGSASFYLRDAHGSTRGLANGAAAITDRYTYDAYGNTVAATGSTANAYRYDGERLDSDTGLYQLRDRYYNPAIGRFMSRDPFSGRAELPVSRHRYQFANSDPVNFVDPSGRESLTELSFVQGLQSMLNTSYGLQIVGQVCNLKTQVDQAKTALWVSDVLISASIFGVATYGALQAITGGTFKGTLDSGFESAELPGPSRLKKFGVHAKGGPGTFGVGFAFDFYGLPSIKADFGIYPPPFSFSPQFSLTFDELVLKEFKYCGDHGLTIGKVLVKGEIGAGVTVSPQGTAGASALTIGLEATLFRGAFKFGYPIMTLTGMPEPKFEWFGGQ